MWLIAFEHAEITSTYGTNGDFVTRAFRFAPTEEGVETHSVNKSEAITRCTTVKLVRMRKQYRRQCPKRLDTVAAYIAEEPLNKS